MCTAAKDNVCWRCLSLLSRLVREAEMVRLVKDCDEEINLSLKLRVLCFVLSSLTFSPILLSVVDLGMITTNQLNFEMKNCYLNM